MKLDEQARNDRRRIILEAAERCFTRKGFHQTSMQDICRETGMSAGNLYRYFDSKEAVIEAFAEVELQWMTTAINDLASSSEMNTAILDTFFWVVATQLEEGKPELTAELLAEAGRNARINAIYTTFNHQLAQAICDTLAAAKAAGQIAPRDDFGVIARILIALGDGIVMHKLVNPDLDLLKMRPAIETAIKAVVGMSDGAI